MTIKERISDVLKSGARNSKMDLAHIQSMHDAAVTLGASCGGAEDVMKSEDAPSEIPAIDDVAAVAIGRFVEALKTGVTRTSESVETAIIQKGERARAETSVFVPIVKADASKHTFYGVVYEPYAIDTHGDWMRPAEIEKAAHGYMLRSQQIGLEHTKAADPVRVVESYIAPTDFSFDGSTEVIKAGSWVMGTHVDVAKPDGAAIWDGIEKGDYTGYSMHGEGWRTPAELVAA